MADDEEERPGADADPGRRRFLKIATCAIGGGIGAAVAVPAARYLLDPVGKQVVTTSREPIDVIGLDELAVGGPPVRVRVVARSVRDAWSSTTAVPLGGAWLQRPRGDDVVALSTVCPHLGCAIGFDAKAGEFRCPCHDSAFRLDGSKRTGPAERGLDPLPVEIDPKTGRVRLTWIRYRMGGGDRTPV